MPSFPILIMAMLFLHGCATQPSLIGATSNGDATGVRTALDAGADPDNESEMSAGQGPLHIAAGSSKPGREEIIRALLAAGADPNLRTLNRRNTPLHMAYSAETAKALLEYGADDTIRNASGELAADRIERVLIINRAKANRAHNLYPGTGAGNRLDDTARNIEEALAALGREPVTAEQAREKHPDLWNKFPELMTRWYPDGATPPRESAANDTSKKLEPIPDSSGRYLSPYTSDGVVAEWVNKSINNQMGSAAGSAVGAAAGNYAAQKALENVPGGALLGSIFGSKAGKAVGNQVADDISGGDAYRRQTSDLSFRRLNDMATWLVDKHGDKGNFGEVVSAANRIYPGLAEAVSNAR